jgi:hypothetical protein
MILVGTVYNMLMNILRGESVELIKTEDRVWGEKMCHLLSNVLGDIEVADFHDKSGQLVLRIERTGVDIYTIHDIKERSQYGINLLGDPHFFTPLPEMPDRKVLQERVEGFVSLLSELTKKEAPAFW